MNSNLNNFMQSNDYPSYFQTPEQVHLVNSIHRKQLYKDLKFYNGKEIWRENHGWNKWLPPLTLAIKYQIWSFLLESPEKNFQVVMEDLKTLRANQNIECNGRGCRRICNAKDMWEGTYMGFRKNYCSEECAIYTHNWYKIAYLFAGHDVH